MVERLTANLDEDTRKVSPNELRLDLHNPRMAELEFETEDEVISYLLEEYDVDELVVSIMTAGWLDYEPLIVERPTNIVLEGNRRLAALRLIADEQLRKRVGYELPQIEVLHPESRPAEVRVRYVDKREDADVYIGFKHINGPFKWDSLAKAKFAADWIARGQDIDVVSRTLGDTHNTVLRLINGWNILQRAIAEGFDPSDTSSAPPLPISHLYTALTRPSVRSYLGITAPNRAILAASDIPMDHVENLMQLMDWLYGSRSRGIRPVIRNQNPDLNTLVRVLAHSQALEQLIATGDLDDSEAQLTPSHERFELAVRQAARDCEEALRLSGGYDGNPTLLEVVNSMGRTVRALRDSMIAPRKDDALDVFSDAPRQP